MSQEDEQDKIKAIRKELDELVDAPAWSETNFLRQIGKDLHDIRDEFLNNVGLAADKAKITSHAANRMALRSGQQEIFIALYSTDGSNLATWERIIQNLPRQVISRPIYADETDVKAFIKSKENRINEAYVSIFIEQSDLLSLPPDKTPMDKLGKPLLTLKDRTLNLDNLHIFTHQSGVYHYENGRLIKQNNHD